MVSAALPSNWRARNEVRQWSLAVSIANWQCGLACLRGTAHRGSDGFGDQGHKGTCEVVELSLRLVQAGNLLFCHFAFADLPAVGVRGGIGWVDGVAAVPAPWHILGRLAQGWEPHCVGAPERILLTQGITSMRNRMALEVIQVMHVL